MHTAQQRCPFRPSKLCQLCARERIFAYTDVPTYNCEALIRPDVVVCATPALRISRHIKLHISACLQSRLIPPLSEFDECLHDASATSDMQRRNVRHPQLRRSSGLLICTSVQMPGFAFARLRAFDSVQVSGCACPNSYSGTRGPCRKHVDFPDFLDLGANLSLHLHTFAYSHLHTRPHSRLLTSEAVYI